MVLQIKLMLLMYVSISIIFIISVSHGKFDRVSKIWIGGLLNQQNRIVNGFDGIIGGEMSFLRLVFENTNFQSIFY